MKNCKIVSSIKNFIKSNDKLAILSLSIFVLGVFLCVISFLTPAKDLQNQRSILAGFCIAISIYLIPFLNMNQKDRFFLKFGILFINLVVGAIALAYWIDSIHEQQSNILYDLLFAILLIFVLYYFLLSTYQILKFFIDFIGKLTIRIFPNSQTKPNGFKYIMERITAILITISGTFATLLAIASSFKAIIDMFK